MRFTLCLVASGLLATSLLAGCSREPAEKPAPAAAPPPAAKSALEWPAFVDSFIEARFKTDPSFAVQSGRHEFDGKMPDWSRAWMDANIAELRTFAGELAKRDPLSLSAEQRFEHEHLQWVIDTELFWLTEAESPFRNPAWYIERLDPSSYLTREYAPLPKLPVVRER